MGLFDRFKKKNQEEEAVQEKNTAQDTAEEQVRDPEEKMQGPARTVRERVEAQLKCFEENKNVEEGLKLLRELLGDVVCMPVTMSMTLDALDSLNAGKDFNLDQAMDVKPDVIAVNGKERALPVFTSRDRIPMDYLQKKQLSVTELSFRQACQMLAEGKDKYDCMALNPHTTNMRVPREVAESLIRRAERPKAEKLQIGVLQNVPENLAEAVKKVGQAHPEIRRIFLQFMIQNQKKIFLLVVDGEAEALKQTLGGLAEEFKQASGGTSAGVATFAGQMKVILEQHEVKPVYMKEG